MKIADENAGFLHAIHRSDNNIGFCAAQNRLITATPSDYVLVLNPDVVLEPAFLEVLVHALDVYTTHLASGSDGATV